MSGDLTALLSALVWAVASVLLAIGARRVPVLALNLVRCAVATAFFWALLPFFGGLAAVAATPPSAWLWLVASVLALLVVGDTLYFRSLDLVGVSWAMPIASINPLWAVLLAALFLDEPLTGSLAAGAVLVVAGVILVGRSQGQAPSPDRAGASARRAGLLMALGASVLWGVGQVTLRPATDGIDSVVANSIRQPMGMALLLLLTLGRGQLRPLGRLDRKSWLIILAAGLVGTGVGSLLFVMAIQQVGAGRTAVLTTTAPVMALPLSMLLLGERPTRLTLAGTLLTVLGIALVV